MKTSISRDPDLPPFLSDPDSPIEDIDLPVNGPGVLRPGVSRLRLDDRNDDEDNAAVGNNPDAPVEDLSVHGPGVLRPGVPTLRADGHAGAK